MRRAGLVRLGIQDQFLHAPIEYLGGIDFILGRARHFVDPSELLRLVTHAAENTQDFAV
jgi:hypothetical protein